MNEVPLPNPVPYENRCKLCHEGKALRSGACRKCQNETVKPYAREWGYSLEESVEIFLLAQKYLESKT